MTWDVFLETELKLIVEKTFQRLFIKNIERLEYYTPSLLPENKINRQNQKNKSHKVIPTQHLVFKENKRKHGEYNKSNGFLNYF